MEHAETKEKILRFMRVRGPSLPVQIAKEINQSILFTSAFLSELFAEKKLKISNLRVGSSPVYFIPGQEASLEKFSQHLKSKERDAFLLLRDRKFLKDSEQEPAISVALRAIRDFAIPFRYNEEIFWRYFLSHESEFAIPKISEEEKLPQIITINDEEIAEPIILNKQENPLDIFEKPEIESSRKISKEIKRPAEKKKVLPKKITKKRTSQKTDEKFFNRVKEHLAKNSAELLDIESFSKNELLLKVKTKKEEKLVVAYNKKKITEKDIIKAHKKSLELNLPYIIFSLGESQKKFSNFMDALKKLEKIEKIE